MVERKVMMMTCNRHIPINVINRRSKQYTQDTADVNGLVINLFCKVARIFIYVSTCWSGQVRTDIGLITVTKEFGMQL